MVRVTKLFVGNVCLIFVCDVLYGLKPAKYKPYGWSPYMNQNIELFFV